MEVPEIAEGIVRIEAPRARAGRPRQDRRRSRDRDVDPVGACVGMKGSRVQAVVQELRGEKIDIVPWDEDPARFVCNALAPAEVSRVVIDDRTTRWRSSSPTTSSRSPSAEGPERAARVAAHRLALDIHSESRVKEMREFASRSLAAIGLHRS